MSGHGILDMGISDVQGLLDSTVTIEPYKGQDRYGGPTLGSKLSVKCRIEKGMKEIQGVNGQSLLAQYKVILGAPIQVDPRDKITLPKEYGTRDASGDFETVSPPILQVKPVFLRGRHDYTVIILG